jgi:hypothetical protein
MHPETHKEDQVPNMNREQSGTITLARANGFFVKFVDASIVDQQLVEDGLLGRIQAAASRLAAVEYGLAMANLAERYRSLRSDTGGHVLWYIEESSQVLAITQLAALADPPASGNFKNVSVRALLDEASSSGLDVADLDGRFQNVAADMVEVREFRHKRVAHADLNASLGHIVVPKPTVEQARRIHQAFVYVVDNLAKLQHVRVSVGAASEAAIRQDFLAIADAMREGHP